jgi:hypothetical protein
MDSKYSTKQTNFKHIRGGDIPGCSSHSGMCWNVIPSPGILFLLLEF